MRYLALSEVVELHRRLLELGVSLASNHPFVDGNKRVGHAAMETFLVLNGAEIAAGTDEQERLMLDLAAGRIDRAQTRRLAASAPRVVPVHRTLT